MPQAADHAQKLDPFGGRGLPPSVLQGDVALAQNNTRLGSSILESAIPRGRDSGHPVVFMAAESLARLNEDQGNLPASIRVLKDMSDARVSVWRPSGAMAASFWMRIQAQLARVYRKAGMTQEARAVEDQLRTLLEFADADHPIVLALKQTAQAPSTSAGLGR